MILAIIVATVGAAVWGMLWYSPLMVGSQWMNLAYPGKTQEEIGKQFSNTGIPIAVFGHVVTMSVLYHLLSLYLQVRQLESALTLALILGVLSFSLEVTHLPFSKKPLGLYLIDQFYNFAVLVIGAIAITFLA